MNNEQMEKVLEQLTNIVTTLTSTVTTLTTEVSQIKVNASAEKKEEEENKDGKGLDNLSEDDISKIADDAFRNMF